ncbi:3-oxoacyl-(acyl-carrier-protein) synthase III [Alkaliphilus metalliredigens QYMF]|uniref:Beta-ketoacyl-[acyl-carrier-protein] synthase III n=1 Tax=Alkaliphilus metalliredigens (strain QYMF) TaxID=293826 RepID=A6TRU1_ALKMQ|nr:beta-ketoacyl-ACP synthase III [Alkaliphilus metalliredigens]ABR48909.1 3-oxoacyl-(acyl-carrier-protein) synthase III [Alkaliphilus metalliredigens QYMF]
MNKLLSVGITGIGSYLPERVVSNIELEKTVDTSDEWIRTRTGIGSRRVADDQTATSDLATKAAEKALADANIKAEDVDLIIVATCTPDMPFPSTACIVQKNIGANKASAFDVVAVCTGFLYAMTVAEQFIKTGFYRNALVVGAETLTKVLNWEDRNTCVLFGDGAGAVFLQPVDEGKGILSSYMGADGTKGDVLTIPGGGTRMPINKDNIDQNLHCITMDGSEVFKFAVRVMGKAALAVLEKSNISLDEVDYLVPHQANIRIIEAAAKRLNLPMDKVHVNLDQYGNMSAASIPVALDEAYREGCIKEEDIVVLVGFGGGLTWASSVLKWTKKVLQEG